MLVRGEEVTSLADGKPVHINGYGVESLVQPSESNDVLTAIRENVDAIRAAGGMASINHPNFKWAFTDRELAQVDGYTFVEIFNAHPWTNDEGGGTSPSSVAIWDRLLSGGKRVWGLAVDDAHHYTGEFSPLRSNPGLGWVQVRADELSQPSILNAMEQGDFYASTGVTLGELRSSTSEVVLEIEPELDNTGVPARYLSEFTGKNGVVLHQSVNLTARSQPAPLDGYVRVQVYGARGTRASGRPVCVPDE